MICDIVDKSPLKPPWKLARAASVCSSHLGRLLYQLLSWDLSLCVVLIISLNSHLLRTLWSFSATPKRPLLQPSTGHTLPNPDLLVTDTFLFSMARFSVCSSSVFREISEATRAASPSAALRIIKGVRYIFSQDSSFIPITDVLNQRLL